MFTEENTKLKEVIENRRGIGWYNPVRHKPLEVGDKFVLSVNTCELVETELNGKVYKYLVFKGDGNTISEKQLISKGNGLNFIKGDRFSQRLESLREFISYNEVIISISKIKVFPSSFNEGKVKFCIFDVESISESEGEL